MAKANNLTVVCNSSPIINLSKIGRLDLVEKLYQKIIIPDAVFVELMVQGADKDNVSDIQALLNNKTIDVQTVKNEGLVKALRKDLDYGESEVIAMALELNADLVLLDEKDARDIAEIYNLKKTGFLGILIRARQEGLISATKPYLDQIIALGFRIDKKLYKLIIEKL